MELRTCPAAAPLRQQPRGEKPVNVLGGQALSVLVWDHGSTTDTPLGGARPGIRNRACLRAQGSAEQVGAVLRAVVAARVAGPGAGRPVCGCITRRPVAQAS